MSQKKLAVVLFNLGGPESQADVKGFLYNLFSDPYIIGLPWGLRHLLAFVISTSRTQSAQANYAKMGGGSPIVLETEAQRAALEALLQADGELETRVFVGMRYWHPFIEDTAQKVQEFAPDHIVLLPLYPQFSSTTTLTAIERFKATYKGTGKQSTVCCYAQNPQFIAAQVDIIKSKLKELGDQGRILFSAHGLPEKIVQAGDPYQKQVEACVAKIMVDIGNYDHQVCYQSRVGPLKWIGPATDEAIKKAAEEQKNVLVVPIAFVSEHIETLVELDEEYAHLAKEVGIKTYHRAPTVRIHPKFIEALKDEVIKAIHSEESVIGDFDCGSCDRFCLKQRIKDHV